MSAETAALIGKGHAMSNATKAASPVKVDEREIARHEHTAHFTNRASNKKN